MLLVTQTNCIIIVVHTHTNILDRVLRRYWECRCRFKDFVAEYLWVLLADDWYLPPSVCDQCTCSVKDEVSAVHWSVDVFCCRTVHVVSFSLHHQWCLVKVLSESSLNNHLPSFTHLPPTSKLHQQQLAEGILLLLTYQALPWSLWYKHPIADNL